MKIDSRKNTPKKKSTKKKFIFSQSLIDPVPNPNPEQKLEKLPKDYKLDIPNYEEINHPPHYNDLPNGIECIDVIEHFKGNPALAMKHVWRAGLKPGQDSNKDLKKAIWYLERQIKLNNGEVPKMNK